MLKSFLTTSLVRRIKKSILFQTMTYNGLASIIRISTGLVSNKIVAVLLGPSGIALIGQFSNVLSICTTLGTGGTQAGITKYIAEFRNNELKVVRYLECGIFLQIVSTAIIIICLIIGANYFSASIFKTVEYRHVFIILSIALIPTIVNVYFLSILNGYKQFKTIVFVNIVSNITGLLITIVLVYSYKLMGALYAQIVVSFVITPLTFFKLYQLFREQGLHFVPRWHLFEGKNLLRFSAMAFTSLFAVSYIQLLIRSNIITRFSSEDAGLWQGMMKICDLFLLFITSTFSLYHLPRFSELGERSAIYREIWKAYILLIPICILITLTFFLGRKYVINMLFSDAFLPMTGLVLPFMIGTTMRVCGYVLGYILIAKALTKTYILTELYFGLQFFFLTNIFIKYWGLSGTSYAYCLNYSIHFVIIFIIVGAHLKRHAI